MADHIIEDGTSLDDVATTLKAMVEAGRGRETVTITTEEGRKLSGPVLVVYPEVLKIKRGQLDGKIKHLNDETARIIRDATALTSRASELAADPANADVVRQKLDTLGALNVRMRRELLAEGGYESELEQLNTQIARLAALVEEPLDQSAGAGKVRVLDERRVAHDENEIRDVPLRDKLAREVEVDREVFKTANQDFKEMIKTMTGKPLIKAIEDILDREFPELMKAFYPRVYEATGRYHSPRSCAAMMANVVAEMLRYGYHRSATAYRLLMPGLAYLRERRMPMFFLAPDLLEAVLRTDFDDDIDWRTGHLELPYETGVLILPKGSLVHPKDGEVSMLLWSRVPKGDNPSPWPGIPRSVPPYDAFIIMGACPDTMIWYDSILTADRRPTMRLHNLFYRLPGESIPKLQKSNFMDDDLTEQDSEFVEKMGVIVFGTLLAMDARPQLVEHGKLIKKVGKAEKAREFWTPNVIGAKYKLKRGVARISDGQFVATQRAHGGGTHASPRMHWRRGHHRKQPVGPGRKERKRIWIEPILIGAE